jgi:hypothetical protein
VNLPRTAAIFRPFQFPSSKPHKRILLLRDSPVLSFGIVKGETSKVLNGVFEAGHVVEYTLAEDGEVLYTENLV